MIVLEIDIINNYYFPVFALAAFTLADDTNLHKVLKDGNDQFTAQMFSVSNK